MTDRLHPLVTIVGPTGSGKSDLALSVAQQFDGEIINCDSIQLFRHFNIGAAKLSLAERQGIPHHLIDTFNPDVLMTAGEYARLARPLLKNISDRQKLPVLCGGTGFYIKALFEGLSPSPERDEALRSKLTVREARRPGSLHRLLWRLDLSAARRIQPADVNKTIRALEIRILGGRTGAEQMAGKQDGLEGYRILKIGLHPPRKLLCDKINARSIRMFHGGLIEEVKGILALGYPATLKPFESIGYREAMRHLNGETGLEAAIEETQIHSRQYAKRQVTWFRRDPEIVWIHEFGSSPEALGQAKDLVRTFLK